MQCLQERHGDKAVRKRKKAPAHDCGDTRDQKEHRRIKPQCQLAGDDKEGNFRDDADGPKHTDRKVGHVIGLPVECSEAVKSGVTSLKEAKQRQNRPEPERAKRCVAAILGNRIRFALALLSGQHHDNAASGDRGQSDQDQQDPGLLFRCDGSANQGRCDKSRRPPETHASVIRSRVAGCVKRIGVAERQHGRLDDHVTDHRDPDDKQATGSCEQGDERCSDQRIDQDGQTTIPSPVCQIRQYWTGSDSSNCACTKDKTDFFCCQTAKFQYNWKKRQKKTESKEVAGK